MKKAILSIVTVYLCATMSTCLLANSNLAITPVSQKKLLHVDNYVESVVEKESLQGVAISVLINGKLVHQKSFGVMEQLSKLPVNDKTVFPLASITKLFVTTAVHELLLKNGISVQTPISEFLSNIPENWRHIKISELLSHSSGLVDYYPINPEPKSVNEAIDLVSHLPFEYKTGSRSEYIQTGFALLQLLLEKLSGKSLEEYLQARYFDRFNLTNIYYETSDEGIKDVTKIYKMTWTGVEPFHFSYPQSVFASAGLNSSIEDLTNWMSLLVTGQIIPSNELEKIWQGVILSNGKLADFSLGWEFYDSSKVKSVGHGGANTSEVRHYIHKSTGDTVTVIWLSNTLGFFPHYTVNDIARIFMKDIQECSRFLIWQYDC